MSIESDLKKDGIEVVEKLDTLKINSIARNISIKLCEITGEKNMAKTATTKETKIFLFIIISSFKCKQNNWFKFINLLILFKNLEKIYIQKIPI